MEIRASKMKRSLPCAPCNEEQSAHSDSLARECRAISGDGSTREAMGPLIQKIRSMGLAVRRRRTSTAGPGMPHILTGFGVNGPPWPEGSPHKGARNQDRRLPARMRLPKRRAGGGLDAIYSRLARLPASDQCWTRREARAADLRSRNSVPSTCEVPSWETVPRKTLRRGDLVAAEARLFLA